MTTILTPGTKKTRTILVTTLVAAAVAVMTAGCPTQSQLARMPGLEDVTPLGPAGKKCYDFCAQARAQCYSMCPHGGDICRDDCVTESKVCLQDCPDLQRPVYPD